MTDSHLVFAPREQPYRALSILRQVPIQSPDGSEVRAATFVMKLIDNSPSAADVAPTELAQEACPAQWAIYESDPDLHQGPKPHDAHKKPTMSLTTNFAWGDQSDDE